MPRGCLWSGSCLFYFLFYLSFSTRLVVLDSASPAVGAPSLQTKLPQSVPCPGWKPETERHQAAACAILLISTWANSTDAPPSPTCGLTLCSHTGGSNTRHKKCTESVPLSFHCTGTQLIPTVELQRKKSCSVIKAFSHHLTFGINTDVCCTAL